MMTKRKNTILGMFAHKSRLAPARQVVSAFWPDSPAGRRNARREIAGWRDEGFLALFSAKIRRVDSVALLHAGSPCDPLPDIEALADDLHCRWQALPVVSTRLVMATPRLVRRLGGVSPARVTHEDCLAHDAGLGALLLSLLRSAPRLYAAFVSEDALPVRAFSVNPDGYFASRDGPTTVVEFCGSSYKQERLSNIIQFAQSQHLGWQLWGPAEEATC
jgi:hypothetical protein